MFACLSVRCVGCCSAEHIDDDAGHGHGGHDDELDEEDEDFWEEIITTQVSADFPDDPDFD